MKLEAIMKLVEITDQPLIYDLAKIPSGAYENLVDSVLPRKIAFGREVVDYETLKWNNQPLGKKIASIIRKNYKHRGIIYVYSIWLTLDHDPTLTVVYEIARKQYYQVVFNDSSQPIRTEIRFYKPVNVASSAIEIYNADGPWQLT